MFNGYYQAADRRGFITAALNDTDGSSWNIAVRRNPASSYPSDFDIITVRVFIIYFLLNNFVLHSYLLYFY